MIQTPNEIDNPFKKRSRRIGEFFAENLIKATASVSILVIFLILVFVLRESSGVLAHLGEIISEKPIATASTSENEPETYGEDVESTDEDKPEIYNPDSGEIAPPWWEMPTSESTVEQKTLFDNLLSSVWQPVSEFPKFGLYPLIVGTAKTTVIAILIAAPLGILSAMYSAFFAPRKVK